VGSTVMVKSPTQSGFNAWEVLLEQYRAEPSSKNDIFLGIAVILATSFECDVRF